MGETQMRLYLCFYLYKGGQGTCVVTADIGGATQEETYNAFLEDIRSRSPEIPTDSIVIASITEVPGK